MVKNYKIEYEDGKVVEKDSVTWDEEPGFISGIREVTETDHRGNKRITTHGTAFPGTVTRTEGLTSFQGTSEGLEALSFVGGGILGAVLLPIGIAYGAGKLIYKVATIGKRKREAEEVERRFEEWRRSDVAQEIDKILEKYNNKLSDYKDLFDLGIVTEKEYNEKVQEYIRLSTAEVQKQQARLNK